MEEHDDSSLTVSPREAFLNKRKLEDEFINRVFSSVFEDEIGRQTDYPLYKLDVIDVRFLFNIIPELEQVHFNRCR